MISNVLRRLLQHELQEEVSLLTERENLKVQLRRALYLVVVFTNGVLTNPSFASVLVKVLAKEKVAIVPVIADKSFLCPDSCFHQQLLNGSIFNAKDPRLRDVSFTDISSAYKAMFDVIALGFSPQASERIQQAEIHEMLPRFRYRKASHHPAKFSQRYSRKQLTGLSETLTLRALSGDDLSPTPAPKLEEENEKPESAEKKQNINSIDIIDKASKDESFGQESSEPAGEEVKGMEDEERIGEPPAAPPRKITGKKKKMRSLA